jgi:hypothetical protein
MGRASVSLPSTPAGARRRCRVNRSTNSGMKAATLEPASDPQDSAMNRWIVSSAKMLEKLVWSRSATLRIRGRSSSLVLVDLPVRASWLNEIEIIFSIIQRKVLTPNDFDNLQAIVDRLGAFDRHYNEITKPFDWNFTRDDLAELMRRLDAHE